MAVRQAVLRVALAAVVLLGAARLMPGDSSAQDTEALSTEGVERVDALNGGGEPAREEIRWRSSLAVGRPTAGRLVRGVLLPSESATFFTWDPILEQSPNRPWRRWGTDRLVRAVIDVLGAYQDDHPGVARVGVADLSRPHGGEFGPRYGYPGHASHQNGLDVDIYYPRLDRRERKPVRPGQIDRKLAQDLVDRFVATGARFVFVGYRTGMRGPRRVVQAIPRHDDHMHVRLYPEDG